MTEVVKSIRIKLLKLPDVKIDKKKSCPGGIITEYVLRQRTDGRTVEVFLLIHYTLETMTMYQQSIFNLSLEFNPL